MTRTPTIDAHGSGPGAFVVSLDFELYWGARDHVAYPDWIERLEQARSAVPKLLNMFREFEIHATWAVVGMLLSADRQDLFGRIPRNRPRYGRSHLSPYRHVGVIGREEIDDGAHYARTLVDLIARTPNQEVASHTFSHYYCLEAGQSSCAFEEDLRAAVAVHRQFLDASLRTLVFPRNQVNRDYFDILRQLGICVYRGTPDSWLYRPTRRVRYDLIRRGLRFLDCYVPVSGGNVFDLPAVQPCPMDVQASSFLRPYSRKLKFFEPLKLRRIRRSLDRAAATGAMYHLWWHPENFWTNVDENFVMLKRILEHAARLRSRGRLVSLNMGEVFDRSSAPLGAPRERVRGNSLAGSELIADAN